MGEDDTLFEFLLIWCVIRLVEFTPTANKIEYQIRNSSLICLRNMSKLLLAGYLQPSSQEEHTHSLLMTSETVVCLMIINPANKPKDKINGLLCTIEIIPNGSLTASIATLIHY